MKTTTSNKKEALTPDNVLCILRDSYLQQCQFDPEAEPDIELSFETTIEEWRYACDLVSWKPLGKALNEWFKIKHSDEQWHELLEPAKDKKLFDLCVLISSTATRPAVVAINIFGNNCLEAGAFITLRTALANSGIPVNSLRPSTPLHPWLLQYWGEFSAVVGKIAPESLPPVKIEETFIRNFSHWLIGIGIIVLLVSLVINYELVSMIATTILMSGLVLIFATSGMKPKRVSFGKLETIADVCRVIIAYQLIDRQ